jgi:hypothetical protein
MWSYLRNQLKYELRKLLNINNIVFWLFIIVIFHLVKFFMIKNNYIFDRPTDTYIILLREIIPLFFPAIVVIICIPSFLGELRHNFIMYTRTRVPIQIYLFSKAIVYMVVTGIVVFLLLFLPFLFITYIEPKLGIIQYTQDVSMMRDVRVTFFYFMKYGTLVYALVYSSWVTVNAMIYSTIAFVLLLLLDNAYLALSLPFIYYNVGNFVTAVLGLEIFSPAITIFPFNIGEQPLWTVLVPFAVLVVILLVLLLLLVKNKRERLLHI